MIGRKMQLIRAFLLALALGVAAGYGTKRLRERPQELRSRGVSSSAPEAKAPASTDRMLAETEPVASLARLGRTFFSHHLLTDCQRSTGLCS